jgi:hypothetical protein
LAASRGIDHIVLVNADLDALAARFEGLGFTLTPRAQHDDRMGTSNRLAQFAGRNFIELLEVDRPETLAPHDFAGSPPFFSFGAHNKRFVETGNGMSMLVLTGNDAREEVETFRRAGVDTYAPFDFERKATLPDGKQVTVGFSLTYATSPAMPKIAFFTCHQTAPQYFWKPEFQKHANGAQKIAAVYVAAKDPAAHREFFEGLTGAVAEEVSGGLKFPCRSEALFVLTADAIAGLDPSCRPDLDDGPCFAGIAIETNHPAADLIPASEGLGIFIEWQAV